MLNPPYPADLIPDASAGMLAFIAARDAALRAGHVAVSVQLDRGRWTVKVDTLTAPGHLVAQHDAGVLAGAVRALVHAGVARSGTTGPVLYSLERIATQDDARALAAAIHAAVYGEPAALEELSARFCATVAARRDV